MKLALIDHMKKVQPRLDKTKNNSILNLTSNMILNK